jgi:hypothetical protein
MPTPDIGASDVAHKNHEKASKEMHGLRGIKKSIDDFLTKIR